MKINKRRPNAMFYISLAAITLTAGAFLIAINILKSSNETPNTIPVNLYGTSNDETFASNDMLDTYLSKSIEVYESMSEIATEKVFEVIIELNSSEDPIIYTGEKTDILNDIKTDNYYSDISKITINVSETVTEQSVVYSPKSDTQQYDQNQEINTIKTFTNHILVSEDVEVVNVTNLVSTEQSYGNSERSIYIDNPSSITAVVNKNRMLESSYIPDNLVSITVQSTKSGNYNLIRADVLPNLEAMFAAAKDDGINLTVTSPYRSYNTQQSLFNNYVAKDGLEEALKYSAPPGASEHQTGLVVDIGEINGKYGNFTTDFGKGDAGIWLANNSYKYGFVLRYPEGKETITTYQYEPWHFRYIGVEEATNIYNSGKTLEEFYELY